MITFLYPHDLKNRIKTHKENGKKHFFAANSQLITCGH